MAILLLLSLSLLLAPSAALTRSIHLHSSSSTNSITSLHCFAFTSSGHIALTISSLSISLPNPNPNSSLSFFLTPKHSKPLTCPLHPSVLPLISFPPLPTTTPLSSHTASPEGEYTLVFANCVPNLTVSFHLQSSMYNLDSRGRRHHLPAGATLLPTVYFVSALVYFAVVTYWISFLLKSSKLTAISSFHVTVFLALNLRAVSLLFKAEINSFTNRTGRSFHDFDIIFDIAIFVGILSSMFPHPTTVDFGMKSLVPWLVLVLIIIAIVLGVEKKLKEAADTDEKVIMRKRLWFVKCAVVVFSFVCLFAGLVMRVLHMVTSYRFLWTHALVMELMNLAFYVIVGCKFKPRKRSNVLKKSSDGDDQICVKAVVKDV